jgi:hypothetical protein
MNNAIDAEVDEIEPDYEIITEAQPPYSQVKYLDQQDLVKNNTTGEIYKSFQKAFNEATNGDELVTLRDFTNTTQSTKIIIPETSNFTLDIKHHITINNNEFIENNGTAVFNGIITEGSEPGLYTNYGNINANAGGIPFTNNGTLTVNGLEIISIKAGGYVFINNANATLNILGADITTLQSSIVDNRGTLNINLIVVIIHQDFILII